MAKKNNRIAEELKDTDYFRFIVEQLSSCGLQKTEIASVMGVSRTLISEHFDKFPDLEKGFIDGRKKLQAFLVSKALQVAAGYDYNEETIKYVDKVEVDEETGEATTKTEQSYRIVKKKHQPPDARVLLNMLWNINRQLGGDDWQIKPMEVTKVQGNRTVNNIILEGKFASRKMDELAGRLLDRINDEDNNPRRLPENDSGKSSAKFNVAEGTTSGAGEG
ncbi:MAG: hypothetical protein WC451_03255 [Patescibacteria group bacterium]|jgi:hypothetical protein